MLRSHAFPNAVSQTVMAWTSMPSDAGAGVRRTETWEIEAAITDRTVAVAYAASPDSQPPIDEVAASAGTLSYELMCALAQRVPVAVG